MTDDFECLIPACNKNIYSVMYQPPNSHINSSITYFEGIVNYATEIFFN